MIMIHYYSTSDIGDASDDIAANMKDVTTPLPLRAGMSMTTALQVMNYNIKAALTIDCPVNTSTITIIILNVWYILCRILNKLLRHFVKYMKST